MTGPYKVTIFTALPGTPLVDKYGKNLGTSAAGHLWYAVEDGKGQINSYGFAPKEHGAASGPGKGYDTDTDMYQNPRFSRTLQINAEQYAKLKEFGEAAVKEEWRYFKGEYKGLSNSCVDFTWGALKHAGLQIHRPQSLSQEGEAVFSPAYTGPIEPRFDGRLAPGHNRVDIEQIVAPVPGSPLNKARDNPPPANASFIQKIISDNQSGQQGGPQTSQNGGPQSSPQHASSIATQPSPSQAAHAERFHEQLGGRLQQLGMNPQQVDTLAAAAAKEQTRFAGQGEAGNFYLSKDGNTIAMRQEYPPLREFSVAQALGRSEQAHWAEAALLVSPATNMPAHAPTHQAHETAQHAGSVSQRS